MRRVTLALVLVLGSMAAAACGQAEKDASAPTASPTAYGVKLLGPLQRDGVFVEEPASAYFFVVEVDTGRVYAIQGAVGGEGFSGVRWLDDDSLLVKAEHGAYEVSLDGSVSPVPSTPAPTSTPQTCVCTSLGCSVCAGPLPSTDGAWTAVNERGPDWLHIDVDSAAGDAAFRLDNGNEPAWSPAGHLLAFIGNVCREFDLFLFDPDSRKLTNLSDHLEGVWDFLWRPDGSAIAVDVVLPGERRALGLIDVQTGAYTDLAEVNHYGELWPLEWSPDGQRLLFYHFGGRGFCEGVGQPGVPTPAPTTLEVLGE